MKLSVVIPAYNEEGCLEPTVCQLIETLTAEKISHEILVINDNSNDGTLELCQKLEETYDTFRFITNPPFRNGFGFAVRKGLENFSGDAVAIVMADGSDDPNDVVTGYRRLEKGYECVFGSRFMKGGKVVDYPKHKLYLNRMVNTFIRVIFRLPYNDITNAFKLYRREVIEGVQPLLSQHFNLTVEIPLKAVTRGYTFTVIPIRWYNRTTGVSKLKIKEMGSRYLFIILYIWLESLLSRGDYHRNQHSPSIQEN